MLTKATWNEIQAEWEDLLQEGAKAEHQLDWIKTRLEALEAILALYSPDLLKPAVSYPVKPIAVEEVLVGFPKRVALAVACSRGLEFGVSDMIRWMRFKPSELRQRTALEARIVAELEGLCVTGEVAQVDSGKWKTSE